MRRYPMADLLEAAGLTESGLTRRAGISGSTLVKAREVGFSADAADRYATRCGFHAIEVWPTYGQTECEECNELFAPHRKGHRFCSVTCARRVRARRWYRARYEADPEFRAAERARVEAYKQESKRALSLKRAAHFQANKEAIEAKRRERRARQRQERAA